MKDPNIIAEGILRSIGCKGKWNVNKKKAVEAIVYALSHPTTNTSSRTEMNPVEEKLFNDFVETLPEKYRGKPLKLIFNYGSGIGVTKTVKAGKKKADITDYNSW